VVNRSCDTTADCLTGQACSGDLCAIGC
jgi:hypothetical protein